MVHLNDFQIVFSGNCSKTESSFENKCVDLARQLREIFKF